MYYVSHLLSLPCGIKPIAYIGGILPDFLHLRGERLSRHQINKICCSSLKRGIEHHIEIDKSFHQNILPKYQALIQDVWILRHKTFPQRRYFFFHLVTEVLLDVLLLDIAYWEIARKLSKINEKVLIRTKNVLIHSGVSYRNILSLFRFMRNRWILRLSLDHIIFIIARRGRMWGGLPEDWQQTIGIARVSLIKEVKTFYEWLHDYGFGLWQRLDS